MSDPRAPIPILVMSYNDLASLRLCLRALVNRTRRAHRLVVVDNASTDARLQRYLHKLQALSTIRVYRNRYNLWVLGLNRALREQLPDGDDDALFALTDCDILVPPEREGQCWLSRLEASMNAYPCVGKLGLSLDLGYIKTRPQFAHTYERERFFMEGPRLGDLIIAPVDTTMALYRRSLFVTKRPLLIPGHASLYRPYYYCCRTTPEFVAKHLSWRIYPSQSASDIASKLICFGMLGATVVPALYGRAPLYARVIYRCARPLARALWAMAVAALQAAYLMKTFPRSANQLQSSRRGH
jgi:glycosyltransferase involved in cell wall biosynthesis